MKSVRRAVAMTLVATALCADKAIASSIPSQQAIAPQSRTLVSRLSVSIRRSVPGVRFVETRCEQDRPVVAVLPGVESVVIPPRAYSPFEFRLPPPLR